MSTSAEPIDAETIDVDFRALGTNTIEWATKVEGDALRAMLICASIQLATVLIFNLRQPVVPLIGETGSVAGHALISSVILSLIVSPIAFLRGVQHRNEMLATPMANKERLDAIPVTIAVTLLVALLIVGGFEIVTRSFQGVMLERTSTATVLVLIAGGLAYVIARQLMLARTAGLLVNLVVTYLLATLYFSTYFNNNPLWWQESFSYLGMTESNSRYVFDLGLIFTGILVVTWQAYFMPSLETLKKIGSITQRSVTIIRWALILAGFLLACVGIFRYGMSPFFNVVHDMSATGMGVMLGLLMLGLRWLVPGYQRAFYDTCLAIAVILIISVVLKIAGFFSLVGLELAAFTMAGLWLVLFYRSTELLLAETVAQT